MNPEINKYLIDNKLIFDASLLQFMNGLKCTVYQYNITKYRQLLLSLYHSTNKEITDTKPWSESHSVEYKVSSICGLLCKLKQSQTLNH